MIRRTFLVLSASMLFGAYGPHSTLATYRRLPRAHQALQDQATSTSLLVGYWHKASSIIAVPRELLISYLLTQSNAVASAVGLAPAPAPAPAPDVAAAPTSLQAPRSVYLQTPTPASPGNCSFDNYRPFYLNPELQLVISATLQSLADNAVVQILSLTNQEEDGPRLASVNGAEKLVNTLQMLCAMQCVADRGDGYSSPAATFYSNDYSMKFYVRFYGLPGPTFECIKESTDLIQDTP